MRVCVCVLMLRHFDQKNGYEKMQKRFKLSRIFLLNPKNQFAVIVFASIVLMKQLFVCGCVCIASAGLISGDKEINYGKDKTDRNI